MEKLVVIDTKEGIELYQLLALRGAIGLQAKGLRFKGGRINPAKAARKILGLRPNCPYDHVIAALTTEIERRKYQ